jgi:hypothetical protein
MQLRTYRNGMLLPAHTAHLSSLLLCPYGHIASALTFHRGHQRDQPARLQLDRKRWRASYDAVQPRHETDGIAVLLGEP